MLMDEDDSLLNMEVIPDDDEADELIAAVPGLMSRRYKPIF